MTSSPLATVRKQRLLTQRDLAAKAKVAQSTIALLEAGRTTPRMKVVRALCEALGVGPQDVDEFRAALDLPNGHA